MLTQPKSSAIADASQLSSQVRESSQQTIHTLHALATATQRSPLQQIHASRLMHRDTKSLRILILRV